jgi:gamma-glutamylcyclotransferase (GGCT)/AIG2-like uncharacterized protein YtfP
MIDRLFAYGTLEIPSVFRAVAGQERPSRPALLREYVRYLVRGERFPGIAERAGSSTPGTLYLDLSPGMIERLDRFEGPEFQRKVVLVTMADGERHPAFAYAVSPDMLSETPWDRDTFVRKHLKDFLAARASMME